MGSEDELSAPLFSPEVEEEVERLFMVEETFLDGDALNFIVAAKGKGDRQVVLKRAFRELAARLRSMGYLPTFRWIVGRYYVTVRRREPPPRRDPKRGLLLLAATTVTVFIDGYLRSNNPVFTDGLMRGVPAALNALVFTVGILAVFGVHEAGHKLVSERKGLSASFPYFIPSWPGMGGTFGAVITQDEPTTNRDDLWDLGMSGPLAGFLATLVIAVAGLYLSYTVPVADVGRWMSEYPAVRFEQIPMPIILVTLQGMIRPAQEGTVLILHPLAFAAWVGFLVTFLNIIPTWQLDGGHVVRALFGRETHKIVSSAGIILMLISGYVFMAVVVAFLMFQGADAMEPLDDVSPVSLTRKLGMVVYLAVLLLSLISLIPV